MLFRRPSDIVVSDAYFCTIGPEFESRRSLRIGHYTGMNIDRDGRTYRNCDNCSDTELASAHIVDCPSILAALQELGVLFSSRKLYGGNIEQIARTVILAQSSI
ncbi:uncharacterized protein TNCV_1349931 [Trichonephila clavipes]|nr:uncharacterized protein TNCV_1349931 [Trichonephila clavipes]